MLRNLIFSAVLVSVVSACATTKWPNGTDTKYNWWQCGGEILFTNAVPQDAKGNTVYPIHLTQTLYIKTQANNPKHVFSSPNLKQTINVWQWGKFGTCSWSSVPTFGLLKNLDACTNGVKCPIQTGSQTLVLVLDFTEYGQIIDLLTNDAPYELQYLLTDSSVGTAACLTFQARAYTK